MLELLAEWLVHTDDGSFDLSVAEPLRIGLVSWAPRLTSQSGAAGLRSAASSRELASCQIVMNATLGPGTRLKSGSPAARLSRATLGAGQISKGERPGADPSLPWCRFGRNGRHR